MTKPLDVRLSKEIVEALEELAVLNDSTVLKEIRQAISDRKFFVEKSRLGNTILLRNNLNSQTIIVDLQL